MTILISSVEILKYGCMVNDKRCTHLRRKFAYCHDEETDIGICVCFCEEVVCSRDMVVI